MEITTLGDSALMLEFGERIDAATNARVLAYCERLRRANWPGILDLVPAYATLGVFFDPAICDPAQLRARLLALPPGEEPGPEAAATIEIPVCYEGEFAPDIEAVCAHSGLRREEYVRRHHSREYRVYFIGFAPGFPYLGELDPALAVPRRATPRTAVPAGSVAIGGAQTGIYPQSTPGGWHIIGRTPLALFDAWRPSPCLLAPGMRLRFVPIGAARFAELACAGVERPA